MEVHQSALKHGIAAADASYAAEHSGYDAELDRRTRRVSLGSASTPWADCSSWSCLRFDSGHELVIHAMKARRQYLALIS